MLKTGPTRAGFFYYHECLLLIFSVLQVQLGLSLETDCINNKQGIYLVAPYELIFQGLGNKKKFEKINEKLDTKNLL